jgi:hypothetical protein
MLGPAEDVEIGDYPFEKASDTTSATTVRASPKEGRTR